MSLDRNLNKILIIDFGSQFTQLIARRIRELGVFSEIISHKKIRLKDVDQTIKGIILSGGPLNVYQINKYSFDKKIIDLDRKISVFKIAVSATASYTEFWGDNNNDNGSNKQDAYAAVVSTINRVNEVFETDLGIRLELVSNDSLIYDNQLNQPYRSNLSNELQETLSKNIGESNYDLGHLFAYSNIPDGESGCIGCVCVDGQKGTGIASPLRI